MSARPSTRALFVVIALPLVMLLERMAWYGTRSVTFLHLDASGWTTTDIGQFYGIQTGVTAAVTVLSGVVAIAVGPLPLIAVGLFCAAAGYAMVPMFPGAEIQVPLYLSVVGTALFRPAIWAAVLIPLARPRESGRIGACVLLYGVSNLAGLLAPVGGTWLFNSFGSWWAFYGASVSALLALLVTGALIAGWLSTREEERAAPPTPSRQLELPIVLLVAGLGFVLCLPWVGLMGGFQTVYQVMWELPFVANGGYEKFWMSANPAFVTFAAALLASIFLLLRLLDKTVPALLVAGPGMVLLAAGLILAGIEPIRMTPWGFGAALALISFGEILAAPALISRIGGDVHWRLTTLFVAMWLAVGTLGYTAANAVQSSGLSSDPFALPIAFAVLAVPAGLLLTGLAIPLQRWVFDPQKKPDSAKAPAPVPVVAPHQL